MKIRNITLAAVACISFAGTASAALYDRGGGMIYDSELDITWLQDANYALTSGYIPSGYGSDYGGAMGYDQATAWVDSLTYGGYSDWRLPSAISNGGNGTPIAGYYTGSELDHLFLELGNKPLVDTAGNIQTGYGLTNTGFLDAGTGQAVSFYNVLSDWYREAEQGPGTYEEDEDGEIVEWKSAWSYSLAYGYQEGGNGYDAGMYAWAVRDGDVSPVPVPAAVWLLGSGLAGLFGFGRKRAVAA